MLFYCRPIRAAARTASAYRPVQVQQFQKPIKMLTYLSILHQTASQSTSPCFSYLFRSKVEESSNDEDDDDGGDDDDDNGNLSDKQATLISTTR